MVPWSPPQNAVCCQLRGILSLETRLKIVYRGYTVNPLARRTAMMAAPISGTLAARISMWISFPMRMKTREFMTKTARSQKVVRATLVVGLMARRRP